MGTSPETTPMSPAPQASRWEISRWKKGKKKKGQKVILIPASNAVTAPLDRISNLKMVALTLLTFGFFPIFWFTARFPRFNRLARKEEQIDGWFAVLDMTLFAIWWAPFMLGLFNIALVLFGIAIDTQMFHTGSSLFLLLRIAGSKSAELFLTWPFVAVPIMFLVHRYLILWARWNLRSFVARRNREMAKTVAPSWFFLWLFGALYIQHHINLLHDAKFFLARGQL